MICEAKQEMIQDWFDEPESGAMPSDLAEHVRACENCKSFISTWNGIELGLQGIRDEAPAASLDFTLAVRARLQQPVPRFRFRMPLLPVVDIRSAMAGSLALALLVAAIYVLVSGVSATMALRNPAPPIARISR